MNPSTRTCPACGATLASNSVDCMYCRSKVVPVALSFQQREEVNRLARRLNVFLAESKDQLLRTIDWLTAVVGMSGVILILALWFYFHLVKSGWIFLILFVLICMVLRETLRRGWAANQFIHIYRREVEPQIARFIANLELPRWQFDQMASFILDEDAPLRRFLFVKSVKKKDS